VRKLRTLAAAGMGAAAMYLVDPDRGRGRRAQLRDRFGAATRRLRRDVERQRRYEAGVAEGARHADLPPRRPADDQALADRIRSELGSAFPSDRVVLNVVEGVAEVRGEVDDQATIDRVVQAVSEVAGVAGVENLLHLTGTPPPAKADAIRASTEAATDAGSVGSSASPGER
jgi:osmotically-inducible protein OsmY